MQAVANAALTKVNVRLVLLCTIGLVLSVYVYIVHSAHKVDPSYTALCDISETVSCSDVLQSKYSKGFGIFPTTSVFRFNEIPNFVFGIIFYATTLIISLRNDYASSVVVLIFGVSCIFMSMYLAFVLYTLKKICIVCVGTYIVNALLLYYSLKKFRLVSAAKVAHRQKTK